MTISVRQIFSQAVWLLGVALLLLPENHGSGWAMTSGISFAVSLLLQPSDNRASLERGQWTAWDQRDAGEKFSIIMFHVLIAIFVLFSASLLAGLGEDGPVSYWRIALAAALITAAAWKFWHNWNSRNAG